MTAGGRPGPRRRPSVVRVEPRTKFALDATNEDVAVYNTWADCPVAREGGSLTRMDSGLLPGQLVAGRPYRRFDAAGPPAALGLGAPKPYWGTPLLTG